MCMSFKKFIEKTKEPFSYVSDVSQIIQVGYSIAISILVFYDKPLINQIRKNLFDLNPYIKLSLLAILLVALYRLLQRLYKHTLFIIDSRKYAVGINNQSQKNIDEILIGDYGKIVPPTRVVSEIFETFSLRARKWNKDCYLAECELNIWYKRTGIEVNTSFEFFSPTKKATVRFHSVGLKVSKEEIIKVDQIQCDDYRIKKIPFFQDKKWRRFIKLSMEKIEHDIGGHEFYLNISSCLGRSVRFYLDPGFSPHKAYTFFLEDGKMYSDSSCKIFIYRL